MTLLAKIVRRRPGDLLLAVEALVLLAIFRVCLALVPVRRIIRAVTHKRTETSNGARAEESAATESALDFARRVRWAVSAIARHSAVEFVCFPQALAGYTMLRWRNVPSMMVYGVTRSAEGELMAHTWLTVGDKIVLGGEVSDQFTPIERWT
jgi:Transglutaminase-like superfamily